MDTATAMRDMLAAFMRLTADERRRLVQRQDWAIHCGAEAMRSWRRIEGSNYAF